MPTNCYYLEDSCYKMNIIRVQIDLFISYQLERESLHIEARSILAEWHQNLFIVGTMIFED